MSSRTDQKLAEDLAVGARDLLCTLRAQNVWEGRSLGDAGDAIANAFLMRALADLRPDDAVLSEETADDPARVDARRVWIVDPLDGTREYSEGRMDWGVHVALVKAGQPVASAVAIPELNVFGSGSAPASEIGTPPRIAVSRSRPPEEAQAAADVLGAELVPMGSAGFKAMAVVRGEVDAYLHSGGQYEWDSAAPVGVARSAALHTSRIDGSQLVYNRPDPLLPDLLICRPELADAILAAVAS